MKKILFVLETSGGAGQDIHRALIYRPYFEKAGIGVSYIGQEPQHSDWIRHARSRLAQRIGKSLEYNAYAQVKFKILRSLNDRRILREASRVDIIYLIKVSSLSLIRQIRAVSKARLVYDLGDALWLPTFAGSYQHIDEILKLVDVVTTDNKFGVAYAKKFCREVHQWDPCAQVESFDPLRRPKPSTQGQPLTIGWLGSPGTLYNLFGIWEALEDVFAKYPQLRLILVGAGTNSLLWPPFERVQYKIIPSYTNNEMFRHVLDMDIGIFPMFDVENSKVRGAMKALIYMAGEAAVVCSPRGVCVEEIRDGENGFLADSRQEWAAKLGRLIEDTSMRKKLTDQALDQVRKRNSIQNAFDDLRKILGV